jgi:hypothetical protein
VFHWRYTPFVAACLKEHLVNKYRMDLPAIRAEIESRRRQIFRQRKEIHALQRAGINTVSAEELLARMLAKVDELAAERDRQVGEWRVKYLGTNKAIRGRVP